MKLAAQNANYFSEVHKEFLDFDLEDSSDSSSDEEIKEEENRELSQPIQINPLPNSVKGKRNLKIEEMLVWNMRKLSIQQKNEIRE